MNKTELIKTIATGAGVSQPIAAKMLNALQESIENALQNGKKVSIRGFGAFEVSQHAAKRCRHPQTGEAMVARAYRTVRFVPSSEIKGRLN